MTNKLVKLIFRPLCEIYTKRSKIIYSKVAIIFLVLNIGICSAKTKYSIGLGYPQTITYFDTFQFKNRKGLPTLEVITHLNKINLKLSFLYVYNYAYSDRKEPLNLPNNFMYLRETYQISLAVQQKIFYFEKLKFLYSLGITTKASNDKTHLFYIHSWNESIQRNDNDFLSIGTTGEINIVYKLSKHLNFFNNLNSSIFFINTNFQKISMINNIGISWIF